MVRGCCAVVVVGVAVEAGGVDEGGDDGVLVFGGGVGVGGVCLGFSLLGEGPDEVGDLFEGELLEGGRRRPEEGLVRDARGGAELEEEGDEDVMVDVGEDEGLVVAEGSEGGGLDAEGDGVGGEDVGLRRGAEGPEADEDDAEGQGREARRRREELDGGHLQGLGPLGDVALRLRLVRQRRNDGRVLHLQGQLPLVGPGHLLLQGLRSPPPQEAPRRRRRRGPPRRLGRVRRLLVLVVVRTDELRRPVEVARRVRLGVHVHDRARARREDVEPGHVRRLRGRGLRRRRRHPRCFLPSERPNDAPPSTGHASWTNARVGSV
mmetsp:Transcript_36136/g.115703  ORF Transcript_36136/g.115703 Transcript_36136/m.115703 type:complete len:320 (-) Transcript_36136:103-1062(-)